MKCVKLNGFLWKNKTLLIFYLITPKAITISVVQESRQRIDSTGKDESFVAQIFTSTQTLRDENANINMKTRTLWKFTFFSIRSDYSNRNTPSHYTMSIERLSKTTPSPSN